MCGHFQTSQEEDLALSGFHSSGLPEYLRMPQTRGQIRNKKLPSEAYSQEHLHHAGILCGLTGRQDTKS